MPFSSLNRFRMDRQMTSNGARQQWIGLPEGASFWFRFGSFTFLSNPFRISDFEPQTLARRSASPCAESPRALSRYRNTRSPERVGGHLEDGVPHAEALSPANRFSSIKRGSSLAGFAKETLAVSALATTQQISSM
jgi:hypothetical protein